MQTTKLLHKLNINCTILLVGMNAWRTHTHIDTLALTLHIDTKSVLKSI